MDYVLNAVATCAAQGLPFPGPAASLVPPQAGTPLALVPTGGPFLGDFKVPADGLTMLPAEALGDPKFRQTKKPKQQAANKVSQQRYRERKKAKVTEMEDTIAQLQERLAQLQSLQQRNYQLEGANTALEARLIEREREIEQLKTSLDRRADASLAPQQAQQPGEPGAEAARTPLLADPALAAAVACCSADSGSSWRGGSNAAAAAAGAAAVMCCAPLARDIAEIDFDAEFERRTAQLRAAVERCGLRDADPSGAGVDPAVLSELARLVGRCCQLRQAAIGAEGAKALALFGGRHKWLSALGDGNASTGSSKSSNERWRDIIMALRLSREQQEQLLMLRRAHLYKLRGIYQDRQDLNLEAMALMLPRASPMLQLDTTIEGKLSGMSSRGYLAAARCNLQLTDLLSKVSETMRREQRAVMDLNTVTVGRILTPIQSALYFLLTYPEMVDILAMVNALAHQLGQDDIPGACCGACGLLARGGCGRQANGGANDGQAGSDPDACGGKRSLSRGREGQTLSGCKQGGGGSCGAECCGGTGCKTSGSGGSCSVGQAPQPSPTCGDGMQPE